ncbi:hypothetical protein B0H16DRAFT_354409 [Mycena metata]|uniref:HMG box domain-containing protein n=1 Tax=Mycena metata TaxID=1033252 RepID=A0AAD7NMI9_9AGAR|nr:hypothetical protein B0H16DRAFT_354409 [Mycena metata]
MPVERSRGSRRTGADGTALVWTQPSVAPGIAFATNLTPGTFEESASPSMTTTFSMFEPTPAETTTFTATFDPTEIKTEPVTPSSQTFFFFDTPVDETKPKRASHKRKPAASPASPSTPGSPSDSPNSDSPPSAPAPHIPRPPNAFILFRSSFIRAGAVPAHVEPSHASLSAIAGLTWAALPPADKAAWHQRAKEEREKHRERFPGYAFRPRHRTTSTSSNNNPDGAGGTDGEGDSGGTSSSGGGGGVQEKPKRRQREVPPADRPRNAHIASLLLTGLAGPALDEAIARFDQERRERGEGGVEVRFGVVETPEGRVKAAADACERATSPAVRRSAKEPKTPRRRKASGVRSPSSSPSSSASPASPTMELTTSDLPPFAFDFDLESFPPSPVDQQHNAFDWPYSTSSSPLDGFDTVPSSPFDSYPPSPALSHASASSSAPSISTSASWEDLSLSLSMPSIALRSSPLSACSSMSSISSDVELGCSLGMEAIPVDLSSMSMGMYDAGVGGLLPPYDLDLGLGCGVDMDAYLTSYVEGTQTSTEGLVAW